MIRQAFKLPRGTPHRITRLCNDAPLPSVPLVAARRVLLVAVDARALGAVAALATRRGLDIRYAASRWRSSKPRSGCPTSSSSTCPSAPRTY